MDKPDGGIRFVGDIAFADVQNSAGQAERLLLDLYLPDDGKTTPRPTILWFHGGGFRPGNDRRQVYIPMFAKAFAARGFAGVAPDYRLRSDRDTDTAGTVSDAVADGRKALAWVRAHAAEYGLDATRLILAGGSAGGMLVLNMCHDAGRPIDRQRDNVRAIFDMWGTPGGVLRLFAHPYAGSLPTLLIHGTADKLVPYQNSVRLARELSGLGVANRLLTLPDAPHTPLAHFEQIVAAMEAFLREHVAP